MPAYLSRIAAAATAAAGGRRPLSPAVRSRSPIVERDQRLLLTNADWSFEDAIGSSVIAPEELGPIDPAAADTARNNPELDPSLPVTSVVDVPPMGADLPNFPPPSSRPERAKAELRMAASEAFLAEDPESVPQARAQTSTPLHILSSSRAEELPARPMRANVSGAPQPQPPSRTAIPTTIFPAEFQPAIPPVKVTAVPRAPDPADQARPFTEFRRVPQNPPAAARESARFSHPEMGTHEPAPAVAPSGVVIGRIEVEVVPPPAAKPVAKTSARPPSRSAPVSQIGPLRGVAKHLAFSLRHH